MAVLKVDENTTLGDFAKVVGDVAANYTFAVANKDGDDTLNAAELAAWIEEGGTSYQVLEHLMKSSLYTTQNERQPLLDYLKEQSKGMPAVEGKQDNSILGILQREANSLFS